MTPSITTPPYTPALDTRGQAGEGRVGVFEIWIFQNILNLSIFFLAVKAINELTFLERKVSPKNFNLKNAALA